MSHWLITKEKLEPTHTSHHIKRQPSDEITLRDYMGQYHILVGVLEILPNDYEGFRCPNPCAANSFMNGAQQQTQLDTWVRPSGKLILTHVGFQTSSAGSPLQTRSTCTGFAVNICFVFCWRTRKCLLQNRSFENVVNNHSYLYSTGIGTWAPRETHQEQGLGTYPQKFGTFCKRWLYIAIIVLMVAKVYFFSDHSSFMEITVSESEETPAKWRQNAYVFGNTLECIFGER